MLSATGRSSGIFPSSSSMVLRLFLSRPFRGYPRNDPPLVLTIGTGFFHFFNSFLLLTLPFSRHKATKKAPRVISVPLMSGVLHCFNVAFRALLRITLQPFALHSKRAVVHSKESNGAFPCLLLSVQLVVDTKKEDERIDNAEQIDHCEANEAAQ